MQKNSSRRVSSPPFISFANKKGSGNNKSFKSRGYFKAEEATKPTGSRSTSNNKKVDTASNPYANVNSFGSRNNQRSSFSSTPNRRRFGGGKSNKRKFGENIDILKFVQKSTSFTEIKPVEIKNSFADFHFCREIESNLKKKLYVTPTPIQDQTIQLIIDGNDVVGLANTGTGKTGAFLLPLINKVFKNKNEKVLIIAPTRELAVQIESEFREFSFGMRIFSAICVGGAPLYKQTEALRRNPNFVIGTPGRIKDLNKRNLIKFESFTNIVLDEVDRMLDMGFVDEIREILNNLPEKRQSLFFSATIPTKIKELINTFMKNPITIETTTGETASNVEQDIVRSSRDKGLKFEKLQEILKQDEFIKVLIFIETKIEVERLTQNLIAKGFRADSIHGDKRQGQRQRALTQFKNSYVDVLVATDVAARGLDIKDISHVINYTIPQTYNDYIHRIGRTGRGTKKGKALTFVESV